LKSRLTLTMLLVCMLSVFVVNEGLTNIDFDTIVGIWLFEEDEDEEEKVTDSSGNGHDGIVIGQVKWVDGKFNSALEIAPAGYVRVPHSEDLSLSSFTVTAWVSTEDSGRWIGVVSKAYGNETRNYMMYIHMDTGIPAISIGDKDANSWRDLGAKTVVNNGEWHHVAISFDEDIKVGKIFVDGVQEGQYNIPNEPPLSEADLVFAAHTDGGGNGYIGLLDEIAIFNVALEEEDIKDVMQNGLSPLVFPVEPKDKLSTTWAGIKTQD